MLGPVLVFSMLAIVCVGALVRPAIGVIGYYGFVALEPEWNWRWSLPPDLQYQKYIAIVTLIGFVLHGLRGNRWTSGAIVGCAALGLFLALAILSAQSSILPDATALYLDCIWKTVLMAIIAVHLVDSPLWISCASWVVVICQGYNAYQINLSYLQLGYCAYVWNSWGSKGDNNLYSIFSIPIMAISASLMFVSPQVWKKVVCGLLFTMQMHQLMLLESRGCMIGAIVMAVALLWYMPQTKLNWLAVCTAVILGSILAGPSVVGEFSSSFRQKEDLDVSAVGRFDLWKAGWRITCEYPLLGVGPWAGQRLVPQYIGLAAERKGLHNLFFEISTGCGIPALILYLTYFAIAWVIAVRALWSRRQDPLPEWAEVSYLATASGLVGYFVSSMFSSGALLESSYMLAAFSLATNLVLQHERRFEQAA